jgi:hypothetical protein
MPEIEREEVIAQRLEELQRIMDKRNLDQMVKAQKGGEGDSVAKAAKRLFPGLPHRPSSTSSAGQHTVRGATKEKSRKLDELKAKRKAKDERKRVRALVHDAALFLSRTHPSLVALQNATGLHLPWKWKHLTKRRKMAK